MIQRIRKQKKQESFTCSQISELQDTIMESMPDGKLGYSEIRSVNENKSMAVLIKARNESLRMPFPTPEGFHGRILPGQWIYCL